jgi:L-alanine-DL-glutamate epimerase-like enolase superfamily enzyme
VTLLSEPRRSVHARAESWLLARPFAISRGVKTQADVVVVEIHEGGFTGRGECVPYPRYNETVDGVKIEIEAFSPSLERGLDRAGLACAMPAGAARNALDNALWDLEAKVTGLRVWEIAGIAAPEPSMTAETIGLGSVQEMATAAKRLSKAPLIKVKLDAELITERMQAIHDNAPNARLIIDPNEGWTFDQLKAVAPALVKMGVEMIEQPLPADDDEGLWEYDSPITLCADESCHTKDDLQSLVGKYQMVNIKLDKTGGLTEALELAKSAEIRNLGVMIGCMVGTSLAMAPAMLLASVAEFVDLDGPLLLKKDRELGLKFENGLVHPPKAQLWG